MNGKTVALLLAVVGFASGASAAWSKINAHYVEDDTPVVFDTGDSALNVLGKPQSVLSCYRFAANGVFKPFGFCPLIESFCDRRGEGKSTCQMQNLRMYSNKSKGYSEYWSTVYFR